MRVAALYDIHANPVALGAVLAEVEGARVDLIVVGGDAVPGPLPVPTIELLRSLGDQAVFVRGNTDRWTVEEFDALAGIGPDEPRAERPAAAWTATVIDQGQRDFLASFHEPVVIDVDGLGATLFCHGSPRSDDEILTSGPSSAPTSNSGAPTTTSGPPRPTSAAAAGPASTTSCATPSWSRPTLASSPSRSNARPRACDRPRRDGCRVRHQADDRRRRPALRGAELSRWRWPPSTTAPSPYERAGFREVRRYEHATNGAVHDLVWMTRAGLEPT